MKVFQIENGLGVDLIQHTREILDQFPDTKIYVGCDSQNKKRGCIYAIVVAYRFTYGDGTRKGARYVYQTELLPKMKDKFTRLWGEVEKSVELALWLENKDENGIIRGFPIEAIDLDFNRKITAGSNNMVSVGTGYVKSFGFECTIKPDEQIASRAGDHIVKKKTRKERKSKKRKHDKAKSA